MIQGEIDKTVKLILSDNLDVPIEKIKAESSLCDQLGMDSFGMIEIGFALERAFDTRIISKGDSLPEIVTVKDLVDYLTIKIKENASK